MGPTTVGSGLTFTDGSCINRLVRPALAGGEIGQVVAGAGGLGAVVAKQFPEISDAHAAFMRRQHIFFVASAAGGSHVNVSPRGTDGFRQLGPKTVAYLDRTGSGNETAAHIRADGRITVMFCSLDGPPLILRLYGRGTVHLRRSRAYSELLRRHFDDTSPPGARQIVTLAVDLVQTSCGYGVPLFDYRSDRDVLDRWAENKGESGIEQYWRDRNHTSIDGLPTGILGNDRDRDAT